MALSREERWVAHHVLTTRADETIDDSETPPTWLIALVETIESDNKRLTFSYHQARKLHDALKTHLEAEETPERDMKQAATITARLEGELEV